MRVNFKKSNDFGDLMLYFLNINSDNFISKLVRKMYPETAVRMTEIQISYALLYKYR